MNRPLKHASLELDVTRQHELFSLTKEFSSSDETYLNLRSQQQCLQKLLGLLKRPACDTTNMKDKFTDRCCMVCLEMTARDSKLARDRKPSIRGVLCQDP